MQVVIEPAHRVLNGDVQIPESIVTRHLDLTPDQRVALQEFDAKAQHKRLGRNNQLASASPQLRTTIGTRHHRSLTLFDNRPVVTQGTSRPGFFITIPSSRSWSLDRSG